MFGEVLKCVERGTCECLSSNLVIQVNVNDCLGLKVRAFCRVGSLVGYIGFETSFHMHVEMLDL